MPNWCNYAMKVVGKSKESLERFLRILKYEDSEFYLYRVDEANGYEIRSDETSGLCEMHVKGIVAWSCSAWVDDKPGKYSEKSKLGASYSNLPEICKKLGIGVEIWADEDGMCFQQYILVDHNGRVKEKLKKDWNVEYNKDGDVVHEKGGFEHYGEWSFGTFIW